MTSAPTRHMTTQALVDLVLDPEEHGYRLANQRRGDDPARRWYDSVLVAAGCLAVGFIVAVAWTQTHRGAPQTAQAHTALVDRVRAAQIRVQDLSRQAFVLSSRLDNARHAALPDSAPVLARLRREELAAGQLAAAGPGLEVRLSEPATSAAPTSVPGSGERTPTSGGHILTDRDIRSVVNQLWSDGAEAIAVNGVRLTPSSAIRFAGDAVLVDFVPITSPYTIDAIGAANRLATGFAASDVASRYQTLAGARGIGFQFSEQNHLRLPAAAGVALRYAAAGRKAAR